MNVNMAQTILQFIHDYNYFQRNQPPAPFVKEVIIDVDRITFYLNEIPRRSFADGTRRPIINEYHIEWKDCKRSRWNTICTNTDNLTGFTFYLKDKKFKDRVTGLVNNHWYEYNFFRNYEEAYDIRVYARNKSDNNIEPYTYVNLKLFKNPPCNRFEDYCNTPPESQNNPRNYLIGNNPKGLWSEHKNKICQLTSIRPMIWTFVQPRIGWNIDGYVFNGEDWIDTKLNTAMNTLKLKNQTNDIIFEILQNSHLGRLCGDTPSERYNLLKSIIFKS